MKRGTSAKAKRLARQRGCVDVVEPDLKLNLVEPHTCMFFRINAAGAEGISARAVLFLADFGGTLVHDITYVTLVPCASCRMLLGGTLVPCASCRMLLGGTLVPCASCRMLLSRAPHPPPPLSFGCRSAFCRFP